MLLDALDEAAGDLLQGQDSIDATGLDRRFKHIVHLAGAVVLGQ